MSNNFLILKFSGAKWFPKTKFSKDKSFGRGNSSVDRKTIETFDEPITVHQISNVLHVLFGERPVSTVRDTIFQKDKYIFGKALESYLHISSATKFNTKTGQPDYITEALQLKKAVWNSWNPVVKLNWEVVRRYLGDTRYDAFRNVLTQNFDINCPLTDVTNYMRDLSSGTTTWDYGSKNPLVVPANLNINLLPIFKDWFKNGCSGLIGSLFDEKCTFVNSAENRTAITITSGLDSVAKLSGTIVVPVSEEDLARIYKPTSTILDGGLVWIESVENELYVDLTEFINVGEISLVKSIK